MILHPSGPANHEDAHVLGQTTQQPLRAMGMELLQSDGASKHLQDEEMGMRESRVWSGHGCCLIPLSPTAL